MEAVNEQLKRNPTKLPKLEISKDFNFGDDICYFSEFMQILNHEMFSLIGYNPQSSIKAELKTGL